MFGTLTAPWLAHTGPQYQHCSPSSPRVLRRPRFALQLPTQHTRLTFLTTGIIAGSCSKQKDLDRIFFRDVKLCDEESFGLPISQLLEILSFGRISAAGDHDSSVGAVYNFFGELVSQPCSPAKHRRTSEKLQYVAQIWQVAG